ncbi:tryptophan synthase subunit alpha [Corynebacterium aquilae]|uniref:Tryptophan synthase alpha chain n=1 Tax=Corynebacterium aquilae DSM 44791 TaxID=1431546 RepID=A0A1L7CIQ4_9CORY|nr:tryptophan synthase subunit alpha [Corynebacterium aquilae]APT85734.1 tryptophan synthase alpha chain [Corynebacterium aquilae DSM 44791]
MSRYPALFERLKSSNEGAFVPFVMLGDPTKQDSIAIIEALIAGGADALELGVPFSDPVADGPTIQAAHIRALDAHIDVDTALSIVRTIRDKHPDLPIGLLIYGNVPFARGLDTFYTDVAQAGADSVLLPDIPVREGAPFTTAARAAGIDQIFIAPPHASEATLEGVAANSTGYIYAVSRVGVTGAEHASSTDGLKDVVDNLTRFGGAPALLGFGISTPEHVAAAIAAGAAGAISGSAVTKIVEKHCTGESPNARSIDDQQAMCQELTDYVAAMKAATRS